MGILTVTGESGCRQQEAARLVAQRLHFELISESTIRRVITEQFHSENAIPDKAWAPVATGILARLARAHHLVTDFAGAEFLFTNFPNVVRVHFVAPETQRIGALMIDHRLDRNAARVLGRQLDSQRRAGTLSRFGRTAAKHTTYDLTLNGSTVDVETAAQAIEVVCHSRGLSEQGLLSSSAEAQIEFQVRLQLAKFGIHPPGKVSLKVAAFVHPSEQIFANLLDFYGIGWEYEPKSFPISWDKDGKALESFTPDFYLPEFDLYLELTTMKQSLVTKKNRKVKLLRSIYPHLNIQVFYQKDIQNLIFKHGIAGREMRS